MLKSENEMMHLSPPLVSILPPIQSSLDPSSPHNPQFLFTLSSHCLVQIRMSRLDEMYELGHYFYLLRQDENHGMKARSLLHPHQIMRHSEIVDTNLDIVMRLTLDRGNYIIMPVVYDMDERVGLKGVRFRLELRSEVWGAVVRLCQLAPLLKRTIKGEWEKGLLRTGEAELHSWGLGKGKGFKGAIAKTDSESEDINEQEPRTPQSNSSSSSSLTKLPPTIPTLPIPPSNATVNKKHQNINFENPQFILRIRNRMDALIHLSCPDKGPNDTMNIVIVRGIEKENRKRHQLGDESNIIFESPEKVTSELIVRVELEPTTTAPYIILVGCSSGKKKFSLVLEYSDCYHESIELFAALPLPILDGRTDSHCEDIVNKYHLYGKRWSEHNCVDEIIAECEKHNYYFVDKYFPPTWKSVNKTLWNVSGKGNKRLYDEWRRPSSFLDNPMLITDGIDVQDMVQGSLNNAWILQAIAACALDPKRIENLFYPSEYSERGIYSVRLFIEGKFQYVLIDDFLPIKNGRVIFAHSKDSSELWASLLEKAVAKVFGNYARLEQVKKMHLAFVLLTGGYTRSISITRTDEDELWKIMQQYCENQWLIGALSKKRRAKFTGLISDHFYCILDVKQLSDDERLVHLYNVWGWKEWKGDYSDTSFAWTKEIKNEMQVVDEEDGLFWMEFSDFICHYSKVTLCKVERECGAVEKIKNEESIQIEEPGKKDEPVVKK